MRNMAVYHTRRTRGPPVSRLQIRAEMPCQREPAFPEMWALVHSEALLEERLQRLAHQMSDANLQQMPEFHQRVEVLRRLEYLAPDNTVLIKVSGWALAWQTALSCLLPARPSSSPAADSHIATGLLVCMWTAQSRLLIDG